jgi:uncharacterized protein (TIGR00303 family)
MKNNCGAEQMNEQMIGIYTEREKAKKWLEVYGHCPPVLACVLGFTETGLQPGISAAGATPADRRFTAIADAEFLYHGPQANPKYPLPPLDAGASPVVISRAVVEATQMPVYIFNAGLPLAPAVPHIDLGGTPAACVSTGKALSLATVNHLLSQGLEWGKELSTSMSSEGNHYVILGECVVGGTTTALAVLLGLGFAAAGKVNSSHPRCNHGQKLQVVEQGWQRSGLDRDVADPLQVVAAVGDPMQVAVAGMAIAASRYGGVMLAGGTQMLAVYALAEAIAHTYQLSWRPENIVVGTTRWVAEDPTGDTVGLASLVGNVPLLGTTLSFAQSRYPQLQAYERGFVKEGVAAGSCAIAAHLWQNWEQAYILGLIENLLDRCIRD